MGCYVQSSNSKNFKGISCLQSCLQAQWSKVRSRPHPPPQSSRSCRSRIGFLSEARRTKLYISWEQLSTLMRQELGLRTYQDSTNSIDFRGPQKCSRESVWGHGWDDRFCEQASSHLPVVPWQWSSLFMGWSHLKTLEEYQYVFGTRYCTLGQFVEKVLHQIIDGISGQLPGS